MMQPNTPGVKRSMFDGLETAEDEPRRPSIAEQIEKQIGGSPRMLGRSSCDGVVDDRAGTTLVARESEDYCQAAQGTNVVEIFRSLDDEDRGGIVLRFSTLDGDCSFVPHATAHQTSVNLYLAGDAEAAAFVTCLRRLLDRRLV